MASIAASLVCTNGLKKRSRLNESFDLSRKKRQRCVGENTTTSATEDTIDESDVVKSCQRHVAYFEQNVKQAEIARMKTEYDHFLMKKEVEFQQLGQELQQTQDRMMHQANELMRLQGENKLLKRAVAIQNQQKDEVQQENKTLKQLTTQAAEHIKRLEQANYTLRVHLQTSTNATIGYRQPPDVY
ncbi:unnamed protein product [Peronospora belbahrii]|uniref:Uncharacterized protein n=1 Tax=Peronospora belbahrii TaxID=622444 RepID=A0AAU9LE56_9STRA|nr:unnamed protein product [Peronospora belbahrii]CAH0518689.1 unnamed protein product [Peronospora belbahrii]